MVAVSVLLTVGTILLWILLAILAVILLLLLLILLLPLDLHLRLDSDLAEDWESGWTGAARWLVRMRWGWGLLRAEAAGENLALIEGQFRIMGRRIGSGGRAKKPKKERPKPEKPAEKKRKSPDWELIRAGITEGLHFLGRLKKALGLRWKGRLTYGFADPALTGWTEALLWATDRPIPVDASFQQACLLGQCQVNGRIYGRQVVWAALQSLRNPVLRRRLFGKFRFKRLRHRTA